MTDSAVQPQTRARRGLWLNLLILFEIAQGLLLGATGALVVALRNEPEVRVDLEGSAIGLGAAGLFIAVLGVLHLVFAVGLARRSEMVRSFLAAVATVQAAVAVFALISRQDARLPSVFPFLASAVILWVLYGSDRTREFFEQ